MTVAQTDMDDVLIAVERLLLLLHEVYTADGVLLFLTDLADEVEVRAETEHSAAPRADGAEMNTVALEADVRDARHQLDLVQQRLHETEAELRELEKAAAEASDRHGDAERRLEEWKIRAVEQ